MRAATHAGSDTGAPLSGRVRGARTLLAILATVIPVALFVQVYLAGLFLMGGGGEDARAIHVGLGRALQFYPLLLLAVGVFAGVPRPFWFMFGAFWVAAIVQAWLPLLDAENAAGWVRALHPLNGFFLLGFGFGLTRFAWALTGRVGSRNRARWVRRGMEG